MQLALSLDFSNPFDLRGLLERLAATAERGDDLFMLGPLDDPSLLSQIIESFPGFTYVYDLLDQRPVYTGKRWASKFGYSHEETRSPGALLGAAVHPDDHHRVMQHHADIAKQAGPEPRTLRYRIKTKEGVWTWLESEDRPFRRDQDGRVVQIVGSARDITREVELQEQTLESEGRFRSIVETLPDAVFIGDQQGKITEINPAACEQLGYTRDELLELNIQDFIAPEFRDRAKRRVASGHASEYLESVHIKKDGTRVPVEVCVVSFTMEGRLVFLGVARDIRERKALEARVREAERLEAMGRLSGSVAHDFNNLLAVILGGAELLVRDESLNDSHRRMAREVSHAAERGAELTSQLLSFSRRRRAERKPVDLGQHVEETLTLVRRLSGERVRVESELEMDVIVRADPGMLDQVIVNLAVNARDTVPQGGTIAVVVRRASRDAAELIVSDTGGGIAEGALPHLFDPFFTTKILGRGTGLGLAAVQGIVHQHGGEVRVLSEKGKGACFVVTLPTVSEVPKKAPSKAPVTTSTPRTILIVDDQDDVRTMISRMLVRLGHRCLVAGTAEDARLLAAQHNAELDILLTDVTLGEGVRGTDLATELAPVIPKARVIYMSGYDEILTELSLVEGWDFIQKPISLEMLQEAIDSYLPGPDQG